MDFTVSVELISLSWPVNLDFHSMKANFHAMFTVVKICGIHSFRETDHDDCEIKSHHKN